MHIPSIYNCAVDFTKQFSIIERQSIYPPHLRGRMNVSDVLSSQGTTGPDSGESSIGKQLSGLSSRWLLIAGLLILGVVGFSAWRSHQVRVAEREAAAELAAQPPEIATVSALGELEPKGELINLTAQTSAQGSRLDELLVEVGDRVRPGQVVAVLDSRDQLQAALQSAEQQVEIARAQLAQVKAGSKTGQIQAQQAEVLRLEAAQAGDIAAQSAVIARLEAEVANARLEAERYEFLNQRGAISTSERDARQLALSTAQRQLQEARASLSRIQTTSQQQISQAAATLDQIQEVRPVDVSTAEAEVSAAIARVAEAKANLAQSEVRSPVAGQVVEILTRPGERLADAGVLTLGNTGQMQVVAEVYQDDIPKVEPGQSATITTPVIEDVLTGQVERIGLQVEQQAVVNEDPAINIDAKIVEVYINLDPASSEKVAGFTNLQVTATIETE